VPQCCPVVEFRQYTLRPGQREVLVELFDRALVEPQEAVGMELLGQFRDLDRPERFVWLRGFPDMESRRRSLQAFYGGPVWQAHGAAASATMIDVDDVLLLRPATPSSGFGPLPPRPAGGDHAAAAMLVATICLLDRPADAGELERTLLPRLAAATPPALALFVEEPSENTYPALPVRAGEHVVVWVQGTPPDAAGQGASVEAAADMAREMLPHLVGPPVQLRLDPTPRSRLR
jgi:NIPSNAP